MHHQIVDFIGKTLKRKKRAECEKLLKPELEKSIMIIYLGKTHITRSWISGKI